MILNKLKYIKWIFLSLGIIGIIILSIMFINENNKQQEPINDNSKLSNIYDISWFKTRRQTYENDKLTSNIQLIDSQYIVFKEKYIEYHDTKDGTIQPTTNYKYDYKNNNKTLTIYGPKQFLLEGTYDLSFENEELKLVLKEDNKKTIYYFNKAVG